MAERTTRDPRDELASCQRFRATVRGAVQGVGFRPFVYRLAKEHRLKGWVLNSVQGVFLEVEGPLSAVQAFHRTLVEEPPPRAFIQSLEHWYLDPVGFPDFEIRQSQDQGAKSALVLPDVATCNDCYREVLDPKDRRFRYPFTNCTNCGPRFSIIRRLPYDRPHTSMAAFPMCQACAAEYQNPEDRRFHAQPNACPDCGPQLRLWDARGSELASRDEALLGAENALRVGQIVALKGLGGFHLMVDARSEQAVQTLRARKHREEKPLAVMFPNLEAVREHCMVGDEEARLLTSPEAPIVLVRKRPNSNLAPSLAPANPWLGVMLPYTPLHHLLLSDLAFPVVATSGNLSEEPICIDNQEAVDRLGEIADLFLVHDRPIVRPVDDSLLRVVADRPMMMRRARGFAPLPIPCPDHAGSEPAIAVGGHLKNTVAFSLNDQVFVSQHVGDLEAEAAMQHFRNILADVQNLYDVKASAAVCDAHPDYRSTLHAESLNLPLLRVQHHHAHVLACMAENEVRGRVLGVAWDGTGYGPDGTVWGGEFLAVEGPSFVRLARLRPFPLPGGERAIKEPCRSALGLWFAAYGGEAWFSTDLHAAREFAPAELRLLRSAVENGVATPWTSSMGRLFDGVASLLGLQQKLRFEGQAAMALEFAADTAEEDDVLYPFPLRQDREPWELNWQPCLEALLADRAAGLPIAKIARRFHRSLAAAVVLVAQAAALEKVLLTGGCFQNRLLTEACLLALPQAGFQVYRHQRIPPNDGGIAVGQILAQSLASAAAETPASKS
ncbi:MAG: carbamoyltransferase HypF [Planctomycetota bacterium]|nr:MAG: carbamoyltransferase HypF [Planctomycetota bacterium]